MATTKPKKRKAKAGPQKSGQPQTRAAGKKKKTIPSTKKKMMRKTLKKSSKLQKPLTPGEAKVDYGTIRKTLLEMRQKILNEISEGRISKTIAAPTDIGDLVDQAGEERERQLMLLLTTRDKEKLLAIAEALDKLKDGSYGICEECGCEIKIGRLRVMPLARSCVNCQSNLEKEISLQRKVDEDFSYRSSTFAQPIEEEEG